MVCAGFAPCAPRARRGIAITDQNHNEERAEIPNAKRKADWPTMACVTLVLLLGLALRLWGIGWSLPNAQHPLATYHPDELVNLAATQNVDLGHGQFDTQFYNYGAFYFYLANFAQTFGRGYGLIATNAVPVADAPLPPLELIVRHAPEQAGLFLAGRIMTALLGAATIPLLFALGNRLFGRRVGMGAALLYAIAPLAVVHAHFLTVDVPATFFVTLALWASARLLDVETMSVKQAWGAYVGAGMACGLCAATKYNTGLVLIAPLVAHYLNRNAEACRLHRKAHIAVMLIAAAFAFLVGCPGPLINWNVFWNGTYPGSGVRYELFEHSRTGHDLLFVNTGPGWWYHLVVSLPYGLGIPLLLLSLAGVTYACRRRTKGDVLLLAFLLLYFGVTGFSAVRFARYMLPLFPVLCLFAYRLVCEPLANLNLRRMVQAAGALTLFLTGAYMFALTQRMTQTDPRDLAAAYLSEKASPGASITFAKTPWYYSPPLSPRFGELAAPGRRRAAQEVTRYQLRIPEQEWDTSVLSPLPDYIVISNSETLHTVDRLRVPNAVAWMQAIPASYKPQTFGSVSVFGLPPNRTIIPDDLLYILPTLRVYKKQ